MKEEMIILSNRRRLNLHVLAKMSRLLKQRAKSGEQSVNGVRLQSHN